VAARADFLKSLADFGLLGGLTSVAARADFLKSLADFGLSLWARADFRCVGGNFGSGPQVLDDFLIGGPSDRAESGLTSVAARADFRSVRGNSGSPQVLDETILILGSPDRAESGLTSVAARADFRCVGGYSASPQVLDEPRGYSFSPQVLDDRAESFCGPHNVRAEGSGSSSPLCSSCSWSAMQCFSSW